MARTVDLITYLPKILQNIKEFKEISKTENQELNLLWQRLEAAFNDQYIKEATEYGVKRWESILAILSKGTDTLNERKFRILTRLNEQLPYSWHMLVRQLETLCGKDGYTAELKNQEFTIKIRVALTAKSNFDDVDTLLHRVAPVNIIIDLDLIYNQHKTLHKFTHAQISKYTHTQLREEVLT